MTSTNTSPVIGFIDIDAFECQLFQREEPQYRNCPCVVATQSGRILSATYEAKARGVSRGTTPKVKDALKVCPELRVFRKPDVWGKQDGSKTRHATWELLDAIKEFCRNSGGDDVIVELASSDELYLDISAEVSRAIYKRKLLVRSRLRPTSIHIPDNVVWERRFATQRGPFVYYMHKEKQWKQKDELKSYIDYIFQEEERLVFGSLFMNALCAFIEAKTQLASSGGVASNKLLAKVGCGINKPGKITICSYNSIDRVAKIIPITSIPGLGSRIGEKLCKVFNVTMMSEIPKIPLIKLEAEFDTELSQRIRSWAGGKDNQPVEARVMKDKFSCNKPTGLSINGITKLRKTLNDLVGEMLDRFQEEKKRHRRVCNTIRIDLTFVVNPKQGSINTTVLMGSIGANTINSSTAYDTTDIKFKMHDLPERAFCFIKDTPAFDINNFVITELGLTAKDFVFLDGVDLLQQQLDKLTLTSIQKTLRINVKPDNAAFRPTFQNQTQIGSFRTTDDGKYSSKNVTFPIIRPQNILNSKGVYLGQGYELPETKRTKLIVDHAGYYEFKHYCFVQWLREFKFFTNFSKPDFIAFHGRIQDPMQTPLIKQWGDWEIYAMNVGGIIFLWDQKEPQAQSNIFSYYSAYFRALVTKPGNSADETHVQEFDKAYLVNQVSLGRHQILMVNNVGSTDENGDGVQMSLFNDKFWPSNRPQTTSKKLKIWAQALISGAKGILIGKRYDSGVLKDTQYFEIEEFRTSQLKDVDTSLCLQFENRLLDWIKLHLPVSNQKVVKKFSWVGGHQNVISDEVPQQEVSKLIVPRLYSCFF